jgi:hypothetical protein
VFLDLDQFNLISDSFGHAVGDMMREISKRLGRCLREADALMQGSFRNAPGEQSTRIRTPWWGRIEAQRPRWFR